LTTAFVVVTSSGCASGRPRVALGPIAVLRLDAVGGAAQRAEPAARRAIAHELSSSAELVSAEKVEQASAQQPPCSGDKSKRERCAVARGRVLGAKHVVAGALGGLGRTFVIQLDLIDVRRAAVTRSLEETHFGSPDGLGVAVGKVAGRLVDRRPAGRSWFKKWWVWTIAAALVGGGVAAAVLLTRKDDAIETVPLP